MAVFPKPASTVVLMPDRNNGSSQPEVLMVERYPNPLVGPAAYVFPGGLIEPQDSSLDVCPLSLYLTTEAAAANISEDTLSGQALGFFMATIRENFEETLVLFAGPKAAPGSEPHSLSRENLIRVREGLAGGGGDFFTWLESCGLRPFTETLKYIAHWITRKANPQRFSTHFFLVEATQNLLVIPW